MEEITIKSPTIKQIENHYQKTAKFIGKKLFDSALKENGFKKIKKHKKLSALPKNGDKKTLYIINNEFLVVWNSWNKYYRTLTPNKLYSKKTLLTFLKRKIRKIKYFFRIY
jgi:hypothetical protein